MAPVWCFRLCSLLVAVALCDGGKDWSLSIVSGAQQTMVTHALCISFSSEILAAKLSQLPVGDSMALLVLRGDFAVEKLMCTPS